MTSQKYYLPPGLQVVRIDEVRLSVDLYGRRLTLKDETGLVDAIFAAAAQGELRPDAFVNTHGESWPRDVVMSVIESLCASRFLSTADQRTPTEATMDFLAHSSRLTDKVVSSFGTNPATSDWRINIAGNGELARRIACALDELDMHWSRYAQDSAIAPALADRTLLVACADHTDHAFFRDVNASALAQGLTTLFVNVDAYNTKCGPVVVPKSNACYECYFHRLNSTRTHVDEFEAASSAKNFICRPAPSLLTMHWAVSASLTRILAIVSGMDMHSHLSPIQEINASIGESHSSHVLKIPRCPVCGTANGNRPFSAVINTRLALKAE